MESKKIHIGKKVISLIMSFAMLLSIVVIPEVASAALPSGAFPEYSSTKADVSYEFIGVSPSSEGIGDSDYMPSTAVEDIEWEENGYIWVGVYFENMDRLTSMFSSAGLQTLTLSLLYDSTYLSWDKADATPAFEYINGVMDYYLDESDWIATYPYTEDRRANTPHYESEGADAALLSSYEALPEWTTFGPIGLTSTDTSVLTVAQQTIRIDDTLDESAEKMFVGEYISADKTLVAVFPLKMVGTTAPAAGTKIVEGIFNSSTFYVNNGVDYYSYIINTAEDASTNLANVFNIVENLVDIFPAAESVRTLQSIAVKGGTYAIPAQYVDSELDVTGLTIEGTYNLDPTTADIPEADVSYKYANVNTITDATDAGLTAVPEKWTAALEDQYLYAIAGGKITLVGQFDVSAVVIDEVTGVTGVPSGVYEDDTINMSGISATVNKNDGTDGVSIPYADFGTVGTTGLAVYKVVDTNGFKTYIKITPTDTYALGDNVFVVGKVHEPTAPGDTATAPTFVSPEFTVNAAYDSTTLSSAGEDNKPKVKYAVGNKFDPTGIAVKTQKASKADEDPELVTYDGFELAGLSVVIAADETAAKAVELPAGAANENTEITADMIGKKIYVVVDNNGTKSVIEVGTISDRGIKEATASGVTADAKTYGDTLGDGISLTLKYDNGDADETINYADFGTKNVTMKIGDATVDKDTVLTPDMSGKTVDFYVNGIKVASSVAITVNKKAVNVIIITTSAPEKVYDGATTVEEADVTALGVAIDTDALESADSALAGKIGVTGLTFTYADKNVGTGKTINYAGTPAAAKIGEGADADVTTFNSKYTLALGSSFDNGALVSPKGTITAKTLNVTAITGVPTVEVGAETLTGSGTLALATTNSDIISGENVTLSYDYAYANADAAGEVDVTISNGAISGADAANYTLGTVPATAKGEVTNKKLASVTVVAPTKTEYTYPDTKLDLTGMKINLNYEGASAPTEMEVADFIADGGIISLTDATGQAVTVTADNMTDTISLPYGETTITITYGGKTAEQKVTAAKKKVSLADITFNASKVYGNDKVSGTYTVADGVIEAGDAVTVEATYTFTEDPETAGENKEVKVTDIKLVGDAAANYELDGTETTINTGIVSQGEQVAPAKPTVTVDPKTNNLTITGPIGENIEYSIDGGKTWVTDTTFKGLGNGKTVTVQARVKATEDGNLAASDASLTDVKTLKYHVVVYQAKLTTEKLLKEVYTDDISKPTKDTEVNTMILDGKPSGFKAYFSDAEAKVAQTYPLTADGNGEVVLYMTKATGGSGGGGGSSTYKVTFSAGTKGEITDGKAIANVTSKVTAVPTVTAKEGYKFVGWSQDGTTVVDPLTVKITKATTFTAVYESAVEETPVPTVEPTQEPVDNEPIIDVNYTAPYASGYEDGSFRPENNITRAELAAMIARLSYGGDLPDGMYDSSFPDVADDAWYNKYIAYLEDKNVLSGYEDGTFRPTNTITRGEISAVIARAQRYEILPYSGMFADVTDSDWAKDYIETLATKNIVTGYEDGTFGPYSPLTRAEAVAIINRVLAPSTPVVTFTPNDIAGHWAEADIILAVNERIVNGTEVVEPAPVEPEATEAPAEEVTEETVVEETTEETVENSEATEEVTENTEDAANVAPEGVEGTEITTETEETTEVPAE